MCAGVAFRHPLTFGVLFAHAELRTRRVPLSEPNLQRQQSVLSLLQRFNGTEPLKQLFWSELNYDRVNRSLSRRDWNPNLASLLADDPVLLASGADAFHVIYGRLTSDKLLRGDERQVVSKMLQDHPYALFVFSNSNQEYFHFLNVKYDDDVQKRRLFRRITVGPNERLRTASERIALLDLAGIRPNLFGLSSLAVQQRHDEAFDVEPVTREFFSEYRRIFEEVEEGITGFGRDKDRKRLYTQRLFNRLMFIAFIQKKDWLNLKGDADYLSALWKAHLRDNTLSDKNFYRDRLKLLFFSGLNTPNEVNIIGINRGGALKDLIGHVPYLNGGLFDDDEDDNNDQIKVPDNAIDAVLNGLFAKFNFTVTESTPLDVEVAVDPEMLGKIFEELVTGRHETGSYYTPKPIVSFMCREALKGYLKTNTSGEKAEAITRFVEQNEPDDLRNAEGVLDALRKVKVCDPACGSGAYLLGMLHELIGLRSALFHSRKLDAKSVYDRKLEIIQSNIYGVDLDQFAVNIARLRLWLSLAVDYEGTKPEPLPNLDYKVEGGDSLLGPNPSGGLEMGFRKQLIDDFLTTKAQYLTAHHGSKKGLRNKIEKLKHDIASFGGHSHGEGFDWAVEFAEVFLNCGFDIVLANPPYVRQEVIRDIKPSLQRLFPEVYSGTADLYVFFYARAVELLRPSGMLAFISADKWLQSQYGSKLRLHLGTATAIQTLIDFGDLPVFHSATAYPAICIAQKGVSTSNGTRYAKPLSLEPPYPDIAEMLDAFADQLPHDATSGTDWKLVLNSARPYAASFEAVPLLEYVNDHIYFGIKTGLSKAFQITNDDRDVLIAADPRSTEIIKPFAAGRHMTRWTIRPSATWLIVTEIGVDIKKYPAVFAHLKKWERELRARQDQGDHWWELRPCAYYSAFSKPKIAYQVFQVKPCFAFDSKKTFFNNSAYIIPREDFYLLGVLNSAAFWLEVEKHCSPIQNGFQLMRSYFGKCLIPRASAPDTKSIADLAQACIKATLDRRREIEAELDRRVETLYFGAKKIVVGR